MKRICMGFFYVTILLPNIYCQVFAPIGATWQYRFKPFPLEPPEEIIELRSQKDTLIAGKTCRWVGLTQHPIDLHTQSGIAFYQENDTIFFVENSSFYKLYDFSLNPGDVYWTKLPVLFDESNQGPVVAEWGQVRVDSIKTIIIDGQDRKLQYTRTMTVGFPFPFNVLEGIGGVEQWLLPRVGYGSSEYSEIYGLICYRDDQIEYGDSLQCQETATYENKIKPWQKPYPNPTSDLINWPIPREKLIEIGVFNLTGQAVIQFQNDFENLNMNFLPNGIYRLIGKYSNGIQVTSQIVLIGP